MLGQENTFLSAALWGGACAISLICPGNLSLKYQSFFSLSFGFLWIILDKVFTCNCSSIVRILLSVSNKNTCLEKNLKVFQSVCSPLDSFWFMGYKPLQEYSQKKLKCRQ